MGQCVGEDGAFSGIGETLIVGECGSARARLISKASDDGVVPCSSLGRRSYQGSSL